MIYFVGGRKQEAERGRPKLAPRPLSPDPEKNRLGRSGTSSGGGRAALSSLGPGASEPLSPHRRLAPVNVTNIINSMNDIVNNMINNINVNGLYIYIYIHTHIHIYIHTHTHIYVYTYV